MLIKRFDNIKKQYQEIILDLNGYHSLLRHFLLLYEVVKSKYKMEQTINGLLLNENNDERVIIK